MATDDNAASVRAGPRDAAPHAPVGPKQGPGAFTFSR